MQARYYDPVIGRFYSNDPASFSNIHNFNRYAYANNNPYKYTDPDGNNAVIRIATPILKNPGSTVKVVSRAVRAAGELAGVLTPTLNENAGPVGSGVNPDVPDSSDSNGKKAQDSGKNSKHGKNGRAGKGGKAQGQAEDLETQLGNATGKKEKAKIKQKMKNIKKTNDSKNKGEEHGKRNKKQG